MGAGLRWQAKGNEALKALTLTQPWASLVEVGLKRIETRSWRTSYTGPLAIHAAKGFPKYAREFAELEQATERFGRKCLPNPLPRGVILCIVNLLECVPAETAIITELEREYGDYSAGRWAWRFGAGVRVFAEPIEAKGALGLWEWEHQDSGYSMGYSVRGS